MLVRDADASLCDSGEWGFHDQTMTEGSHLRKVMEDALNHIITVTHEVDPGTIDHHGMPATKVMQVDSQGAWYDAKVQPKFAVDTEGRKAELLELWTKLAGELHTVSVRAINDLTNIRAQMTQGQLSTSSSGTPSSGSHLAHFRWTRTGIPIPLPTPNTSARKPSTRGPRG